MLLPTTGVSVVTAFCRDFKGTNRLTAQSTEWVWLRRRVLLRCWNHQRCGHILWSSRRVFNEWCIPVWMKAVTMLNHWNTSKGVELCSPINPTLGLLDSERMWGSSVHETKGVVNSSCVVDDSEWNGNICFHGQGSWKDSPLRSYECEIRAGVNELADARICWHMRDRQGLLLRKDKSCSCSFHAGYFQSWSDENNHYESSWDLRALLVSAEMWVRAESTACDDVRYTSRLFREWKDFGAPTEAIIHRRIFCIP